MVLAPTDSLAGVSRSDGVLNARSRKVARRPSHSAFATEWLGLAPPTATLASSFEHPTPWQLNKLGNYHCNNRIYSISHGRWLSPDQAANPFYNLFDYTGHRSTNRTDPSGLFMMGGGWLRDGHWKDYDTHHGITSRAAQTAGICGAAVSYVTDGAMAADGTIWKMIGSAMGYKQARTNANSIHVDNGDFAGAKRWLNNAKSFLEELAGMVSGDCACCSLIGPVGFLVGMMCHTIQDFYHHNDLSGFTGAQLKNGADTFGTFLDNAPGMASSNGQPGKGQIGWGHYDNHDSKSAAAKKMAKYEHSPWEEPPGGKEDPRYHEYRAVVSAAKTHTASLLNWAKDLLPCVFETCDCCDIEESNWSLVFGGEPSFGELLKRYPSLRASFDKMNKNDGEPVNLAD